VSLLPQTQPVIFAHELNAFRGKQDKAAAHVDLVGVSEIPHSARSRIACEQIAEIAHERTQGRHEPELQL